MERQGLVYRTETSGAQIKVEYALTPSGTELMTIVMAMHKWAKKHRSLMNRVAQDLQRHRAGRSSLKSIPSFA
jgi:DNA-binding HxlR family transcriptional regulator